MILPFTLAQGGFLEVKLNYSCLVKGSDLSKSMKQIEFSCCWGHVCMTAQLRTLNTTQTGCCSPACQWAMTEDSFHILKCLNEISYCQKYVFKLLFSVSPAHTPQCPQMSEEMVREGPNWNKLGWTFHLLLHRPGDCDTTRLWMEFPVLPKKARSITFTSELLI